MKLRSAALLFSAALAVWGACLLLYPSPPAPPSSVSNPVSAPRRPGFIAASSGSIAASERALFSHHIDAVLAAIPAEAEGAEESRERQISDLVTWILEHDLASGLAALGEHPSGELSARIEERLLQHGVRHDPAFTVAAILRAHGPRRTQRLDYFFAAWADHDLAAALAGIAQLPGNPLRQSASLIIAGEAVRTRPAQALEFARRLPASAARDDVIVRAAAEWACSPSGDTDVADAEAAAWARELADPALRERLVGVIATGLGETSPLVALDFVTQSLPPGRTLDTALAGIVARWAQTDPQKSAAWVESLPESPLRNDLVETLVKLWSLRDPDTCTPWVNTLPAGPSRDRALLALAEHLATAAPGLAGD